MTHLQSILLFKDSSATTNPSAARSARCRGWALVIERASDKAAKPPGKIRHSSFRQGAGSGCRRPRSSSRKPKHGLQKRVRCSTASSPNGATWRIGLASAMMQKIKNFRTADCVVGGFRYAGGGKVVGSLLPGLYDSQGLLHHVGFTSSLGRRRSTWTDQSTLPKAVGSVTTAAMRSADPDWAGAALKSVRERRDRPVSPRA